MTFANIKKRIASNIGYVDSSGDILTGKDITETDIGNSVNDRYLDDAFSTLSAQYPEDFNQDGKLPFYKTSGTVAAGSTASTLIASSSIFNNGMVGDSVYNSADGEKVIITAYTSATTVTIDTAIGDTWDGDTIYVLGHEFGLGGNATDARGLTRVAVKYDSDNTYYTTCTPGNKKDLLKYGNETYSKLAPVWYPTTVSIDGVPTSAIGILPEATENVANGVLIEYTQIPAALSDDADVPRLPLGNHSMLVLGGTADSLRKLMRLDEANIYEQRYQSAKMELIVNYTLTRAAGVPKVRASSRLSNIMNRNI